MNFSINDFNFSYPIQMRWTDLDPLGHVNNAVYVTYFEVARGPFMLASCPQWDWEKDMFLIANSHVDYRKELTLRTRNAKVYVRTKNIGTKSFIIEYALASEKDGEIILHATGYTTQIMFDMKTRTTIEIPKWVKESLSNFDKIES